MSGEGPNMGKQWQREMSAKLDEIMHAEVADKGDEELLLACNQPRHNSSMIEYARAAYTELARRGKKPFIVDRDSEGAAVYALISVPKGEE